MNRWDVSAVNRDNLACACGGWGKCARRVVEVGGSAAGKGVSAQREAARRVWCEGNQQAKAALRNAVGVEGHNKVTASEAWRGFKGAGKGAGVLQGIGQVA